MLKLQANGYLGRDCKVSPVPSDPSKVVVFFSLATEYYEKGEKKLQWINCSRFVDANKEKLSPYLKTGTRVWVDGKPKMGGYTNRTTGEYTATLELLVNEIELIGSRPVSNDSVPTQKEYTQPTAERTTRDVYNEATTRGIPEGSDDLPF